jgi:hypothetical protein
VTIGKEVPGTRHACILSDTRWWSLRPPDKDLTPVRLLQEIAFSPKEMKVERYG